MSAAARRRAKLLVQLMTERGWERIGGANALAFRCGRARLSWREATAWLAQQGLLEAKPSERQD